MGIVSPLPEFEDVSREAVSNIIYQKPFLLREAQQEEPKCLTDFFKRTYLNQFNELGKNVIQWWK